MKQNFIQGTIYLIVAQIAFVASGYIIHVALGKLLGPSEYGIYTLVISMMTIVNLILSKGIPQALSKFVAHDGGNIKKVRNTSFRIQLVFSLVIFLFYFLLAGKIASLLNDPGFTSYIRASSFIVPGYAIYSILVGYLNGLHEYKSQAITTISYSIFKVLLILGMVLIGYAVTGAILGFVFSPIFSLLIGIALLRKIKLEDRIGQVSSANIKKDVEFSVRKILDFSVPITIFSVTTNLIMNMDLFFVKAHLTNYEVGIYSAASMISTVPFYLICGLCDALFPAIASCISKNNLKQAKKYVFMSLLCTLIIAGGAAVVISFVSGTLLTALYSAEYAVGAGALKLLIVGMGFFSFFSVFTTVLNGGGRPRVSLYLSLVVLGLDMAFNSYLVPRYQIIGAALSTTGACFTGFLLAGLYCYSAFRNKISLS